ncbi:MAG: IMP dehydrogenase, partial [Bacteroidetes bacterium]
APGEYFDKDGVRLKRYRGMASLEVLEKQGDLRYQQGATSGKVLIAQGVSGAVADKGSMYDVIPVMVQTLRQAFQDMGVRSVPELHRRLYSGMLRFFLGTNAAQIEGGVHDLYAYQKP